MQVRHLYIILSGCIAAAAVAGWLRPLTQGDEEGVKVVTGLVADAGSGNVEVAQTLDAVADEMMQAYTASNEEATGLIAKCVQGLTTAAAGGGQEPLRLATPDNPPGARPMAMLGATSPGLSAESVKAALAKDPAYSGLENVTSVTHVNFSDGAILDGDDNDDVRAEIEALRNETALSASGTQMKVAWDTLFRWHWYCADEAKTDCIFVGQKGALSASSGCRAERTLSRVACKGDEGYVETKGTQIFSDPSCGEAEELSMALSVAEMMEAPADTRAVHEIPYARRALTSDCAIVVSAPVGCGTQVDGGVAPSESKQVGALIPWLLAIGSGILMVLIGIVSTRRKELPKPKSEEPALREEIARLKQSQEEIEKKLADSTAETEKLRKEKTQISEERDTKREENARLLKERDSLTREREQLLKEKEVLVTENGMLSEQIEQISREGHGATARIERAGKNGNGAKEEVKVTRGSLSAANANQSKYQAPPLLDSPEVTKRTSAPKNENEDETSSSLLGSSDDSDEPLFPDDGWDDIAASFDAILIDKSSKPTQEVVNASNSTLHGISGVPYVDPDGRSGLGQHDEVEEALSGMSSLLNSLKQQTDAQPQRLSALNEISSLPGATKNSQSSMGRANVNSAETIKPVPSLSKINESNVANDSTDSFKPTPSWTGQKVQQPGEQGLSAAALLEAVTKRAKDVSEINQAISREIESSATRQSGALDFSRSISKSGVFSVTGSRANINLKSDPEYFKELYAEYSEMQRANGEPQKFTCEQFVTHMANQKAMLVKKLNCKSVKFTIYTKDGKTSIKANAIR